MCWCQTYQWVCGCPAWGGWACRCQTNAHAFLNELTAAPPLWPFCSGCTLKTDQLCVNIQRMSFSENLEHLFVLSAPRTGFSALFHLVWTRRSESYPNAQGGGCCLHMNTGASASENHTPDLEIHIWLEFPFPGLFHFRHSAGASQIKILPPVVKRNFTSEPALDNVRDGTVTQGCEVESSEVEGGKERVRYTGLCQKAVGTVSASGCRLALTFSCLCNSQNVYKRNLKKIIDFFFHICWIWRFRELCVMCHIITGRALWPSFWSLFIQSNSASTW